MSETDPLVASAHNRLASTDAASNNDYTHTEPHISSGFSSLLSDATIGLSDGLTVPFALTASLSSLGSSELVVIAGLAELFSGAISMGVGGYLSSLNDIETYQRERLREEDEVETIPHREMEECVEILAEFGVPREICYDFVCELRKRPEKWVDFMMKFELGLGDKPQPSDCWKKAVVIGGSYFIGGLVPLLPYFFFDPFTALMVSIAITGVVLFAFGFIKNYIGRKNKMAAFKSGMQVLFVGGLAAGSSYAIVKMIGGTDGIYFILLYFFFFFFFFFLCL